MERMTKIKVEIEITDDQLDNAIISALEGGSNYWYMIQRVVGRKKTEFLAQLPMAGGALYIDDENADEPRLKKPVRVSRQSIIKGARIMAQKFPSHFADLMNDDADAETGDVLLQCTVFGDAIYG